MPRKHAITEDAAETFKEIAAASFGSRFTTNLFRLFILAAASIVVFYGRTLFNSLVEESPTMVKTVASAEAANVEIEAVKNDATGIKAQLAQLDKVQTRVFDTLKATNAALNGICNAQAKVGGQLEGIVKQLDRVEARQDEARK